MARIKDDDIDRLRDSADIVEVVSGYTQLKKSGGQRFTGLCPFHSEKTPSFQVNAGTNLFHCFAGETGVITWRGTEPISKLAGDTHRLMTTGGEWVDAEVLSFGEQQLWAIEMTRNRRRKTIYATDGHRWFVRSGTGHRNQKEKVTTQLKDGDRLVSAFANRGNLLSTGPQAFGIAHGFTFGDGHRTGRYGSVALFAGNKDEEMLQYFPGAKQWVKGRLTVGRLPLFFKDFPSLDEAPAYLYGWLAGYFAADGCVSTDGQVILSSASKENLEFVRALCNRLGIGTYGIKTQMRLGLGKELSALHHLTFINSTLRPEFFCLSKHRERYERLTPGRGHERAGWVVRSVYATDRVEEVFCAVVPGKHAFVLEDNILTGNCFGCGEGGNLYQFIQKVENLPFPEAVEWLARRMNFELHYEESRPGEQQNRSLRARLIAANAEAAKFFHETLTKSPDALEARRYLESRGFGPEVAVRWQLGYAPGRDALCKHLLAKGFSEAEIIQADLGRKSDKDGALYDFFRQRITFPTWSLQGDVVAFGARALGDQQPKYLNTSDTPVFSKSRVMYGLDRAKSSLGRGNAAVVVEGYTDVIALHEAGVAEAVATNGTALGDTHFEQLKKFTGRAVLMFDADEAGKGAAERGWGDLKKAPLFHRLGLEVLVAPLPPGRDPADVVKEDGPEGINKVIESARPLLEFKLEQTIDKLRLDTPEARAGAVREVARVLVWHPDPIARHEYAFSAANRIGVDAEVIQQALNENRGFDASGGSSVADRDRRLPGHVKVEREALQLLLTRPDEATPWLEQVTEANFTSPPRRELFTEAKKVVEQGGRPGEVAQRLTPEAVALFTELTVGAPDEVVGDESHRAEEVFIRLQVFTLERAIKKLRNTLQDVNPLDDPSGHDQLFTQLVGLEAQRRDLLRRLRREPQGAA